LGLGQPALPPRSREPCRDPWGGSQPPFFFDNARNWPVRSRPSHNAVYVRTGSGWGRWLRSLRQPAQAALRANTGGGPYRGGVLDFHITDTTNGQAPCAIRVRESFIATLLFRHPPRRRDRTRPRRPTPTRCHSSSRRSRSGRCGNDHERRSGGNPGLSNRGQGRERPGSLRGKRDALGSSLASPATIKLSALFLCGLGGWFLSLPDLHL
jgi:hypothetical protein